MFPYKALTTRKGHAASVRRQSRQRLRSERRYRRNWSVHFIDALYELQLPSRDCHVASLLAMTIRGVHRFNDSLFIPQVHHRARLSAPLQRIIGGPAHPPH